MTKKLEVLLHKSIYDKNGHITLIQLPNLPLVVFIVSAIFARIFVSGPANNLFKVLAFGSIFTWAWLEIFSGVNYFRRILGLVVFAISIFSAIDFLQSIK